VLERYDLPDRCTVLMGSVAGRLDPAELAEWILADRLPVRQTPRKDRQWSQERAMCSTIFL
jgi:7-carboxy-7-deazaguanine synthase